jgi:hypothetical protein
MKYLQIERTEPDSGGPKRTPREEFRPLVRAEHLEALNIGAEPELYPDTSPSQGFPWESDPSMCTWFIQTQVVKGLLEPFAVLDVKGDGVFAYPYSHRYLQLGDKPDDGDLAPGNVDAKMAAFMRKYFKGADRPQNPGGTCIMSAIMAGDAHYLGTAEDPGEYFKTPFKDRPLRIRIGPGDGALEDLSRLIAYLEQAKPTDEGYGLHGEWREVWGFPILGEDADGKASEAYEQLREVQEKHPWVHPWLFQGVRSVPEIVEDVALALVPQDTSA